MRLFWQLRASSTTSYTIYISAKNHCGAAFKTCPDFFLVPFEVVEKLSKWSHALSKTSPKQFGRRPEWKIQFQSCRICRHFEELAKLSASRKTFIQAKKKKVLLRSFCDFNNLTGQNNLFQLIIYFILFFQKALLFSMVVIFFSWFNIRFFCFIHSGALGLKLFDWSNAWLDLSCPLSWVIHFPIVSHCTMSWKKI